MPILHVQFGGQGQAPDGSTVQVPPPLALLQHGPRVQITIGVAQVIAQQLVQQGLTVPHPIDGLGLIDTGASSTCVDEAVARQLQLPAIDVVTIATPSHTSLLRNVYPLRLEIIGLPTPIDAPRAIEADLAGQDIQALIGRDILQHCCLVYNGFVGSITFSI